MPSSPEDYLVELAGELRRRGLVADRFVEEVREHLLDAMQDAEAGGAPRERAWAQALERFGTPRVVAASCSAQQSWRSSWGILAPAVLVGLAIAWVDARPHWDDTGITALALFLAGGTLGLLRPHRPWRWALAVGLWIPFRLIMQTPTPSTVAISLVVLAFPFAGACLATIVRRDVTV